MCQFECHGQTDRKEELLLLPLMTCRDSEGEDGIIKYASILYNECCACYLLKIAVIQFEMKHSVKLVKFGTNSFHQLRINRRI